MEDPLREPEPDTVRRAQAGDADAFEELVRLLLPDVYRFVLHIVRHPETAEDVTQDAFLNAYRSLPRFRWRAKFSTWLFGIARNCAVDAIRAASRQRRVVPEAERAPPDPAMRVAIWGAIDDLPPEMREAFIVLEVFGFTYNEASTIMGVPAGTLKSRMHRTRRLLVDALSEEDAGEM